MSNNLNFGIKLTLDGKEYTANLKQAEEQTKQFGNAAKNSAEVATNQFAVARRGVQSISEQLAQARTAAIAYFSIGGVNQFATALLDANIAAQKLQNTLNFAAGGKTSGAADMEYLRATAERLGLDVSKAGQAFAGLSAAAHGTTLAGQPTRDIFEAVAGASTVMGLSADQTQGALLALQQMMSKGTVQAEELRGQLGERIPGAFSIAARAVGKTEAEFNKMLQTGEVISSEFLPKFAAELKKTVASGLPDAVGSMSAELNRLSSSWGKFLQELGKSGAMDAGAEAIRGITSGLKTLAETLPEIINTAKIAGETLGFVGVAVGILRLQQLVKTIELATIASRALAVTPIGLAMVAMAGSVYLVNQQFDKYNATLDDAAKLAKNNKTAIAEMQLAVDRLADAKAPQGYIDATREINHLRAAGVLTDQQAAAAVKAYVDSAEGEASRLQKAKAVFSAFLPPVDKTRTALAELEKDYQLAYSKGEANAAQYEAAKAKIIKDNLGNEMKARDDMLKGAIARELTAEQQKIAALIEIEKKRITEAGGIKQLEIAAQRDTIAAIQVMQLEGQRKELEGAQKLATDKLNVLHTQLASSEKAETDYAQKILGIQNAILGITQDTEDKKRAIARTAMNATAAQSDLQNQVNEKLRLSDDLLAKGEADKAVAAARQAEQLASGLASQNKQIEVVDKAGNIYKAAEERKLAATEKLAEEQARQSEKFKTQIKEQEAAMTDLHDKVVALDRLIKEPRKLDISTGAAQDALDATKRKMDEVAGSVTRNLPVELQIGDALNKLSQVKQAAIDTATAVASIGAGNSSGTTSGGFTMNGDGTMTSSATGTVVAKAAGGRLFGPGTTTSDSILMRGSVDEYVIKASSANRIGYGVLDHINSLGELPKFADGGRIGGGASDPTAPPSGGGITIQNLNLPGINNAHQFVAELQQMLRTDPGLLGSPLTRAG